MCIGMSKLLFYQKETRSVLQGNFVFPVALEVDLSNLCQNKCSFCHFDNFISTAQENMDLKTFKSIIRQFKSYGGKGITLTGGGEPLMNPAFPDCIKFAYDRDVPLGLITNGIFLDRYLHLINLFRFVRVSLNAASFETYKKLTGTEHFNRVIRNIQSVLFKRSCTDVGLSFVIDDKNKSEVKEAQDLAVSLGVDYIQIKPQWVLEGIEGSLQGVSALTEKTVITPRISVRNNRNACRIAGLIGIVSATSDVYFCCVQRGNPDFLVGSLHNHSLHDLMKLRSRMTPDIKMCGSCRYMNYVEWWESFNGNPEFISMKEEHVPFL